MDPRLEANRENWNERVALHRQSTFYDVDGWIRGASGPPSAEIEAVGDVKDRSLVHLQCHFGLDTLRWARAGATVTGVDFSPAAIQEATALAERAGLSGRARFVCAEVVKAPGALGGDQFDVVYVSLGSLCWLPDIDAWARSVVDLLAPGGIFYLHDVHPLALALDDAGERFAYGYFEESAGPLVSDEGGTYTGVESLTAARTYEWNHSMAEIVTSLLRRGLVLDHLREHDRTSFRQFPWLEEVPSGEFVIPASRPRLPLTFTIVAHLPLETAS